MKMPLSALLVEDNESDAALVVRRLEQDGFAVSHELVDGEAGFRAALERGPWDVILCDFNLPGFGAMSALEALSGTELDVPLIVVSGVIVEEAAIDLMRSGASDYVMKDNLARLAPAVRREVAEAGRRAETRRARADLAEFQRRHVIAIESAMDGYAALDEDRRIVDVNEALCALTARSRDELRAMGLADLLGEENGLIRDAFPSSADCPGSARFEGRLKRKDGTFLEVDLSFNCNRGDRLQVFLFIHDISERKRREAELGESARQNERARVALLSILEDQREIERALRDSEENFRGILDYNVAAMFMIDGGTITYCNRRIASIFGIKPEDMLGKRVEKFVVPDDWPRVALALDALEKGERRTLDVEFVVAGEGGARIEIGASATRAIVRGRAVILGAAQDIGERKKAKRDIESYVARLEHSVEGTLEAVSNMLELRDPYTSGHQRSVGNLAAAIGVEMGLSEGDVKGLRLIGYVHDIGKISTPAEVLVKPKRLTHTEFELIKEHSQAGYDVLKNVSFPWPVAETILQHHERLDGSGYPRGLKDAQILLETRIISVADVVEAMSSHRPYRPSLGIEAALQEIEKNAGRLYDAKAVAACLCLFREKQYALPH